MAEELEHEPQPQEPRTELPEEGAAPADGAEPEKKEKKPSEDLFYWLNALTTALVSLVLVFTFIGRLTRVQGESMTNTLQDQQLLLVWSLGYEPKQGDIVVLNKTTVEHLGGVAIVKRVIATGGQTVDIDFVSGAVYVDGELLEEDYINEPTYVEEGTEFPLTVPEGCIFVMGDNRNNSKDSRYWEHTFVTDDEIVGKAFLRYWPLNKIKFL